MADIGEHFASVRGALRGSRSMLADYIFIDTFSPEKITSPTFGIRAAASRARPPAPFPLLPPASIPSSSRQAQTRPATTRADARSTATQFSPIAARVEHSPRSSIEDTRPKKGSRRDIRDTRVRSGHSRQNLPVVDMDDDDSE